MNDTHFGRNTVLFICLLVFKDLKKWELKLHPVQNSSDSQDNPRGMIKYAYQETALSRLLQVRAKEVHLQEIIPDLHQTQKSSDFVIST